MRAVDYVILKRRERMIVSLRKENEALRKRLMDEEVLRKKQIEVDTLTYELNELQKKLSDDLRETEAARDEYIAEKRKFAKLNVEYKRKMEKLFEQLHYKGELENGSEDK